MLSALTSMSVVERLAFAWSTSISAALAYIYVLTYMNSNRNRVTRFVTDWSNRKWGRGSLEGPNQVLFLAVLFSLMTSALAVLALLGKKP